MSGLTQDIAEFVAAPGFARFDAEQTTLLKFGWIDTIGTLLAARDEPVVAILRRRASTGEEARVLFSHWRTAPAAALINGTAGHALDYDDVALGGHPSTVLVPALLAEAERSGAEGSAVLRAYLVGYEVWAELYGREPDSFHLKGWHPTAVLGTIAAAAAVAHLRGLPAAVCVNALGIAASMASGVVANFGSMTKPLHAGRAAAAGIEACELAAAGLTAAGDALEHDGGLLQALSPNGRVDRRLPPRFDSQRPRFLDAGLSIKRYPTCYATHRVIDAVIALANQHDLVPEAVAAIDVEIGVAQARMLRNHAPLTGLEAKFSIEFAVAAALCFRRVGLAQLTDATVAAPQLRTLMSKVRASTNPTPCPIDPLFALSDRVQIKLAQGTVLDSGAVRFARGNAALPLSAAELSDKFLDCAAGVTHPNPGHLLEQLWELDQINDLRRLGCD